MKTILLRPPFALLILCATGAVAQSPTPPGRPRVLIIHANDLGRGICNMEVDRVEMHNLATSEPERVKRLSAHREEWTKGTQVHRDLGKPGSKPE